MRWTQEFGENVRIAYQQLIVNKMRSFLTALGVIIGTVAVTMMGTAVNGIDKGFDNSLNLLGRDVLYVAKFPWVQTGNEWWRWRNRPNLTFAEGMELRRLVEESPDSLLQAVAPSTGWPFDVRAGDNVINTVMVFGSTWEFPITSPADYYAGRFFNESEFRGAARVCVLGYDVAKNLFPNTSALDKTVRIEGNDLRVIGVLDRQGSFLGLFSLDNQVVMPFYTMRRFHKDDRRNAFRVKVRDLSQLAAAEDELVGLLRRVRGLGPGEPNDFEINKSEAFEDTLGPIKSGIAIAGLFITGLSLFVGAIGIMNITFVSVKERTKEIGTRRALGARRSTILQQFLIEAVSICLVGGVIGLAISFGLVSLIQAAQLPIPADFNIGLFVTAIVTSVATGIFSGLAPAWTAARLDPVEALRHE